MKQVSLKDEFIKLNSKDKMQFLDNLQQKKEPVEIDTLIGLCETENERAIKEKILSIISNSLSEVKFENLEKMLQSNDPFVRNGAVEILKNRGREFYPYIEKLSKHSDKDIRKFAIDTLANDSSEEAQTILGEALNDSEINIRITAIEYIGNIGSKKHAKKIEEMLLTEENILLKCTALEALAKIGTSPRRKEIIEKFANDSNPMLIFSFLKYISTFGGEEEILLIDKLIERDESLFNREYIDAIEKIQERAGIQKLPDSIIKRLETIAQKTSNSPLKYEITKLLNTVKGEDLSEVRKKLKSEDEMEVLSAIEILRDSGDENDIELLEELAEDTESDEILEAIGDAVENIRARTGK